MRLLHSKKTFSVQLPSDFREFVTQTGNGGAGPFYGILPLGVVDDNMGFRDWHEGDWLVGIPSEPFLSEEDWNDVSGMPPADLQERNETEYWSRMEAFERVYWGGWLVNGSMPICHEGCALRILLVLTGKQAGTLWEDLRSEYGGLRQVKLADGSPASFGRWYGEWLDACLSASKPPIS
jgi:hypothetical protein